MPEILTESFCERCGTRYTFQSTAPKVGRMAKMKVLSRGLKNYVLSDDTSLDEALAEARSTDDRQHSVEQLDAFHKTFNFCMSCRQYTCANCWNEAEGRCLSCAPSLTVGGAAGAFPGLNPVAGIAGAVGSGNGHRNGDGGADAAAWPTADVTEPSPGMPSVSRLEALFGRTAPAPVAPPESATNGSAHGAGAGAHEDADADRGSELIGLEGAANAPDRDVATSDEVPAAADDAVAATARDADATATDATAAMAGEQAEAAGTTSEAGTGSEAGAVASADHAPTAKDAGEDLPGLVAAAISEMDARDAEGGQAAEVEAAVIGAKGEPAEPVAAPPIDPETDDLAAAAAAQTHELLDRFRAKPVVIPAPEPRAIAPLSVPIPPVTPAQIPTRQPFAAASGGPVPGGAVDRGAIPGSPIGQPFPAPAQQPYTGSAPQPYQAPAPQPYVPPGPQPYPQPAPVPYAPPPYAPPAQPYVGAPPYVGQPAPYPPAAPAQYPPAMPYAVAPAPPPPYPDPAYQAYPAVQPQYPGPVPTPVPPAAPRPSWRMVAPESPLQAQPSNGRTYEGPAPEPEWPTTPSWPAPVARTSRTRGAEAVWAESTRDLLNKAETGVSACFNCGLPLSATARFCRRCGTSQVSS